MGSTLFMDECGYTGQDLLSAEQPIFTMATFRADEEECRALKRKFFADVRADELKLARRRAQREMIPRIRAIRV